MGVLRTIVVEDERLARRKLVMLLSSEPGVQLVGECASAEEAIEAIRSERPELLFLDIQLPTMDGFELLQRAGLENVGHVVIVTAHDRYALKAFDVAAIDYLLKPYDRTRLRQALARVEGRGTADLHGRLLALAERLGSGSERLRRLVIREGERVRFLDVREIDWFESADNYVKAHLGKAEHLVRTTLQALETRLESSRFMRIHRRHLVNVDRIREGWLTVSGEYEVLLEDGTVLPVGRRFRDRLLLENVTL